MVAEYWRIANLSTYLLWITFIVLGSVLGIGAIGGYFIAYADIFFGYTILTPTLKYHLTM